MVELFFGEYWIGFILMVFGYYAITRFYPESKTIMGILYIIIALTQITTYGDSVYVWGSLAMIFLVVLDFFKK